ncbi:MAG: DUF5615 family PIN-like protein [Bryobacteraceae bacterium]|nr:DUF5615 family PIN-like protein [Bryobacteraceae bacterium]
MKLIVDAQLPRQLARQLREAGFDALHTLDLPLSNRTPDTVINELSLQERRIVVTKDADFVHSFLLRQAPWKLLLVSTGNISNRELSALFLANLANLEEGFETCAFIEVNSAGIVYHS